MSGDSGSVAGSREGDSSEVLGVPQDIPYEHQLVAAYGAAQGVPYTCTMLWQSYRIVIGYLNSVGTAGQEPVPLPRGCGRAAPSNDALRACSPRTYLCASGSLCSDRQGAREGQRGHLAVT